MEQLKGEQYQTYEFKIPEEHPFPKDLEVMYIPPKMPGFVGPMPQYKLTHGEDYLQAFFRQQDKGMAAIWETHPDCPHGHWPVSTQEVLCCQELHGGQDNMLREMHKAEVYFYIYDAKLPGMEPPEVAYIDRLHVLTAGGFRRGELPVLISAPMHPNRHDRLAGRLARFITEYPNEPIVLSLESAEVAERLMRSLEPLHNTMVDFSMKLMDVTSNLNFNIEPLLAKEMMFNVSDDTITPRNRRERRQGKQLDSKHKGRSEWWNR